MKSGSEPDIKEGIQQILDKLVPGRFICGERKSLYGKSAIGKPVDRQVAFAFNFSKGIIAIEVANVNTTQSGSLAKSMAEVTQLLPDWNAGDEGALEQLMPLVYRELHRQVPLPS